MQIRLIPLLLVLMLIAACSLKRNNPLDPIGNPDVDEPGTVSGLAYNTTPAGATEKYVNLRWNWVPPAAYHPSGFKIYRSLGYFSEFELVDTLATFYSNNTMITEEFSHTDILPGEYWYKVSAYIHYSGEQPLEGRACDPVFVRVLP